MHGIVAGARRARQIVVSVTLSLAPHEVCVVALQEGRLGAEYAGCTATGAQHSTELCSPSLPNSTLQM